MSAGKDAPDIVVFPPVATGGAMILGAVVHFLHPIPLMRPEAARATGIVLLLLCALVGWRALAALKRQGTNPRPDLPTTAVATDGPYGRTRNPLYVAGLGVYVGVACLIDDVTALLLVIPLAAVLHWGVVLREERYLEGKFGEAYREYRRRVRRWI